MKYLAIIQARCGSSRLPNKVLMDLNGKTVLERVIERVKSSKYIDDILVATSIDEQNLPIVSLCSDLGIRIFVGSENDVLDRYYQAAKLFNPEYVVRITGDCPVFDSSILDKAIQSMLPKIDYLGMLSETFPDGMDLEIFKFEALAMAYRNAKFKSEREHVTLYIRNNPNEFIISDFVSDLGNYGHLRLTLDEQEDYELLSNIYNHFGNNEFYYKDIIDFLNENQDMIKINSMYSRNEGLVKSLEEDNII